MLETVFLAQQKQDEYSKQLASKVDLLIEISNCIASKLFFL